MLIEAQLYHLPLVPPDVPTSAHSAQTSPASQLEGHDQQNQLDPEGHYPASPSPHEFFLQLQSGCKTENAINVLLSGEGPVPVRQGSVSTGIDPMRRGPVWTWLSYVPCNGKVTIRWSLGFGDSLHFRPIPFSRVLIPF